MAQTISKTKRYFRKGKARRVYNYYSCPCGGGQSCIVSRRRFGDWVHEDDVFRANNIPLRKNCYRSYSKEQFNVMKHFYPKC